MADEENNEEQEQPQPKKKNPVLLIVIGVVALFLVIAIVLFVVLLQGSDNEAETKSQPVGQQQQGQTKRQKNMLEVGPIYEMENITVNLLNNSGRRYLKTKVNLELDTEDLLPEIDRKVPVIRDVIIQILTSKQIEEIATQNGKERLKEDLIGAINGRLMDGQIVNIYFTEFVIQ